jgi:hypothetical protein
MLKIAIHSAPGLGDAFLMMIVAHHLTLHGHKVIFFHPHVTLLAPIFPTITIHCYPNLQDYDSRFLEFDETLLQNDHSERSWRLLNLRNDEKLNNLKVLFIKPYPKQTKEKDFTFDQKLLFSSNLQKALSTFYQIDASKENGLVFSESQKKQIHKNRVMIHPTSGDQKRNWCKKKFVQLDQMLKKLNYDVIFCISEAEKKSFISDETSKLTIKPFSTLKGLAEDLNKACYFIGNDSGVGHLASYLGLKTITISGNKKHSMLWRPSWEKNILVTPSFPLPNFKGLVYKYFNGRIRDNHWQKFISTKKVLHAFLKMTNLTNKTKTYDT